MKIDGSGLCAGPDEGVSLQTLDTELTSVGSAAGLILTETYYDDPITATAIRRVAASLAHPLWYVSQWPTIRPNTTPDKAAGVSYMSVGQVKCGVPYNGINVTPPIGYRRYKVRVALP
jgi:hypothetical protein